MLSSGRSLFLPFCSTCLWPSALFLDLLGYGYLPIRIAAAANSNVVPMLLGSGQTRVVGNATLEVSYNSAMQPLVKMMIGGQKLDMIFDVSSGETLVFVKETMACSPADFTPCYNYTEALLAKKVRVCDDNLRMTCKVGDGMSYACTSYLPTLAGAPVHKDSLNIDGVQYDQLGVEAKDEVKIQAGGSFLGWPDIPVRLLVHNLTIPNQPDEVSLNLFDSVSGLLGASGPSLSCRGGSFWGKLLQETNARFFALDFRPPPQAIIQEEGKHRSQVAVDGTYDPRFAKDLLWSQPKQTGDVVNDGTHEFLLYHFSVCGVDLLYDTSSNWLTVLDTSGPCLSLPPFLFDRLRTWVPMQCSFAIGEPSQGRLCSVPRDADGKRRSLPTLEFKLEDDQDPAPRVLRLPLDRLVFHHSSGSELLCVARSDSQTVEGSGMEVFPDMLYAHVTFGSMVLSSFYTVINLQDNTIGLAPRGNASKESSLETCATSVQHTCSVEQTFYPPQNVCKDPNCSEYMFMTLDEKSRICIWTSTAPVLFGVVLVSLMVLDCVSHRLYMRATQKAGEFRQ